MFNPCKSEQQFSKSLLGALKHAGIDCYRIESGETAVGIPDIYCITLDCWLELKNDRHHNKNVKYIDVHWRPGQQAFAVQYFEAHKHKKCTFTIIRLADSIAVIPMTKYFKDNRVYIDDMIICNSFLECITVIKGATQ